VTTPVPDLIPQRLHAVAATALACLLVTLAAGCTSDAPPPDPQAESPLPSRSVQATPTLAAKPVPLEVRIGHVAGERLRPAQRRRLLGQVERVVGAYLEEAYLGGDYPRSRFAGAWEVFAPGVVRAARRDRDLLSNAAVGERTRAVAPRQQRVVLDVLVPHRAVAGLTARVRLVFVREGLDGTAQEVLVRGRLLMNRTKKGPWQVFGYEVQRSASPVSGAGR
jgi:hypothetical protein